MLTNHGMLEKSVQSVVIVGGGTAGWMTAAGLSSMLKRTGLNITLIESEEIGIVGVGEATLPHIRFFNQSIGIDEAEFMAATSATFKLGIEFVNWARKGDSYIHPFGNFGLANNGVEFHQYWRKMAAHAETGPIDDYSLPIVACRQGKFQPPSNNPSDVSSTYQYAYQFDATKYAPFLRKHAEARGVKRKEGKVVDVDVCKETGNIDSVRLESGEWFHADLFIDCSGFSGLLIEKTLKTGYEKWGHWLPCDKAVAAPCESQGPLLPFTRATAEDSGWRWRIPLQHRTGNGYVYSSQFISDENAKETLLKNLEGTVLAEPRTLRFTTGKRHKLWNKNCIAIGLSGGFLEPLESTSIYLIQEGITKLLELFPQKNDFADDAAEYNELMDLEFERIRDFLILHYVATEREDSDFWQYIRTMAIPDSLSNKLSLFQQRGRVVRYDKGLFLPPSWIAVMLGQRVVPKHYDVRVDAMNESDIAMHLKRMRQLMKQTVKKMSDHQQFIQQNGMASS
jgi:tryptophan halogenase